MKKNFFALMISFLMVVNLVSPSLALAEESTVVDESETAEQTGANELEEKKSESNNEVNVNDETSVPSKDSIQEQLNEENGIPEENSEDFQEKDDENNLEKTTGHPKSVEKKNIKKEIEEEGSTEQIQIELFSSEKSDVSKLAHIRSGTTLYKEVGNNSSGISSDKYLNAVYYVKQKAELNGETYYELNTSWQGNKSGAIGWAKAKDLWVYDHKTVDRKAKTFYVKGTGKGYSKAWGGSKDLVESNMSKHTGKEFKVNLTETVGVDTWYRGTLNGKRVWLHSGDVTSISKSEVSKLGHIRSGTTLYKEVGNNSSGISSDKYLNAVYYVKQKAELNGETYYELNTSWQGNKSGAIGWAKAKDLWVYDHKTVDRKAKTFYVKGTGKGYSKAWGGSKDLVESNMSKHTGKEFKVNLTETVGVDTWYRGTLNGKRVWLHSDNVFLTQNTSSLGHIRSGTTLYKEVGNNSSGISSDKYLNAVYYVKQKAELNGETYYELNTSWQGNKSGAIGWAKAKDLWVYDHKTVDRKAKTFYVKGTGKGYSKAWGGSKDLVESNMSKHTGKEFKVNLTETVGVDTWYRGTLNGKRVWLHSGDVTSISKSEVSKLGHIRSGTTLYKEVGNNSSGISSDKYLNAVYYVKQKAELNGETYYELNTSWQGNKSGAIGWAKAKDLWVYDHKTVDRKAKTFYVKGTGKGYSKAWGGSKDLVESNMSKHTGKEFKVNLTETVGVDTWYRGTLNGKRVWLHSGDVSEVEKRYSNYNISLDEAVNIQMNANPKPQTDKEYDTYVSKEYINSKNEVTASSLNVRGGPATSYWVVGQLSKGKKVEIIREVNGWYQIEYTKYHQWVNASPEDVKYYLDPNNFINDEKQKFQFLDLSVTSGSSAIFLNNYLKGKGILEGHGQDFIDASAENGVSDIYLISHALLETGNGTSKLAQGVEYRGVIVYNMFGIGAYDGSAVQSGAKTAYENGWTTPTKAILGGAKFIGNSYIKSGQNTLYKMRWNYSTSNGKTVASHQYASDIGWASKQIYSMYNLYQDMGLYDVKLDIPNYK
ncbi:N-acetylglucosaminidase [Oceanobacillus sp. 1P07AA]|uniref:N-acetylglucosaminidase n=1 Tax=Oceanobacillus sp. 1P07AA TaxID=3132293 RepID=UPI0039A49869